MKIRTIGAVLLLTAASGATLAQEARPAAGMARSPAAPACTGPSCAGPATANHAINEKGTPGTKCPKPAAPPPPSTGGGCNNPCTCPPPN